MPTNDAPSSPALPPNEASSAHPSTKWAEAGIGRDWQYRFFYWLMRLGGTNRGYHMANIVSFGYVLFYPSIRRRCSYYLRRRFPGRRSALRRFLDTYRLVRTYAATLVDAMVLRMFGPQSLTAQSPDHDRLYQLSTGEPGFVLIHGHLGCWQVGMSTLTQFPKHVSIIMLPEARTRLFDPQKSTVVDPRSGIQGTMKMTESLLEGGIVVMMGDRSLGSQQSTVAAQFLGGQVLLPVTPFRLASATGLPVVVMTAPRLGKRTYALRLSRVIAVPPGLGRNGQNYAPYAQQFADCMEEFVRDYPWQFFNFYDMWNSEATS